MLLSTKVRVNRINDDALAKISSYATSYRCHDHVKVRNKIKPNPTDRKKHFDDHRYRNEVQLKKGMRVVLVQNLDKIEGLVNSAQGTIIGFEQFNMKELPRTRDALSAKNLDPPMLGGPDAAYRHHSIKEFTEKNKYRLGPVTRKGCPEKYKDWPIVNFDNGLERTIYADCDIDYEGSEEPFIVFSKTQVPLVAGYAMTIHKSQGLSFDRVDVDLSEAFEEGHVYVALSRARSLKGLKVLGLPKKRYVGTNAEVLEFFEKYLKNA